MAYIGNTPAESFASFEKQVFTIVNSQTAYTLSHSVVNENDIRLGVNNVVQEPGSGKAYTASGTTLTLSAALVNGTDEMYCVFLGRALQTVNPPNASVGSAQVADSLISGKTALGATPADTDELLISDAGTLKRVDFSHLKSANTPAFEAYLSSAQTVTDNTYTKIQFNTEIYDTASAYDNSSNYRFTPQTAGKYFVYAMLGSDTQAGANMDQISVDIYKNGASISTSKLDARGNTLGSFVTVNTTIAVDMNGSSDYLEVFGKIEDSSGNPDFRGASGDQGTNFGAYRILT